MKKSSLLWVRYSGRTGICIALGILSILISSCVMNEVSQAGKVPPHFSVPVSIGPPILMDFKAQDASSYPYVSTATISNVKLSFPQSKNQSKLTKLVTTTYVKYISAIQDKAIHQRTYQSKNSNNALIRGQSELDIIYGLCDETVTTINHRRKTISESLLDLSKGTSERPVHIANLDAYTYVLYSPVSITVSDSVLVDYGEITNLNASMNVKILQLLAPEEWLGDTHGDLKVVYDGPLMLATEFKLTIGLQYLKDTPTLDWLQSNKAMFQDIGKLSRDPVINLTEDRLIEMLEPHVSSPRGELYVSKTMNGIYGYDGKRQKAVSINSEFTQKFADKIIEAHNQVQGFLYRMTMQKYESAGQMQNPKKATNRQEFLSLFASIFKNNLQIRNKENFFDSILLMAHFDEVLYESDLHAKYQLTELGHTTSESLISVPTAYKKKNK